MMLEAIEVPAGSQANHGNLTTPLHMRMSAWFHTEGVLKYPKDFQQGREVDRAARG